MIEITLSADEWKDVAPGTEALIEKWLVAENDTVVASQVLANVVLIKSSLEIVAPTNGRIEKILKKTDETFGMGETIALMKEES